MVTRTAGPFEYFAAQHDGVTGDSIRAALDPVDLAATDLGSVADDLDGDERRIVEQTEGDIDTAIATNPYVGSEIARALSAKAWFAIGCTRQFAADVDTFDGEANELNLAYRQRMYGAAHDPDVRSGDVDIDDVRDATFADLRPRYLTAEGVLDDAADEVARLLKNGPDDATVKDFILRGLLPMTSAWAFPGVHFTPSELDRAAVGTARLFMEHLRRQGLLDGPDPSEESHYFQWLLNAARRGVSIDTLEEIARDHDIRPSSFDVLDDLEEVVDPDGKSYFILPTDISGDDARQAVLMTYVLNAGTDYGTAPGNDENDFPETPYSSAEIQRIIDRQEANSWSYDEDVGFVHGNGGRLTTTPNGILMGLGGNQLQDFYSFAGGTAWGDTFMLNVDDPPGDAAEVLAQVIRSGSKPYVEDGQVLEGGLDLDRLLHHEERHSRQWADDGYAGFGSTYLWYQVTGRTGEDNPYEQDAGLHDGGYS